MPKQSDSRKLPYSAEQMYDLVADVGSYPDFLPWCAATRIKSRDQKDEAEVLTAEMVVAFKVFRESFNSKVTLWNDKRHIDTEAVDGPFKHMESRWIFTQQDDGGCQVDYTVDFQFKNGMLQRVIGMVFNDAMKKIVRAFEQRAHEKYGSAGKAAG